jgi:O-antigen/teichoic acid export membrane protein
MTTGIAGIIVFTLLGKISMGYYAVAMLAARFLMYFPNSINRTFEPHMYQRYGEAQDILELKRYLFKPTFVMAFLFPVVLAFYYTGAAFFIRHFLPKYVASIYPFFVILIARFFVSFSPTAVVFITAINKQKYLVPAYIVSVLVISIAALLFINMGFGILAVVFGLLLAFFFTGAVIFIYAISHYIKSAFKCLAYFGALCLPFLYMIVALVVSEVVISSSAGLFCDIVKTVIKLVVLSIFSVPLIWAANYKTAVIRDIFDFLKLDRFVVRISCLYINKA